jgi:cobalt/nickel transport system permease protein
MTLAFTPPPLTDSPLSRFDPRWKLAALAVAVLAVALLRTLPASACALLAALLLAVLGRLPLHWYLARLGAAALFLAFFALPLPWLLHDEGTTSAALLPFSWHGATVGLMLTAKGLTLVTLMLVLLATAPLDATLKAAHALHVPGLLVQLSLLSVRYVYLLADELGRLRLALRVRGYRNRATRHCYRTVGHVTGTLLVRGYERAERVGQAMRCRGFDGRFRSLTAFHTRPVDVLAFLAVTVAAVGVWWLDRALS